MEDIVRAEGVTPATVAVLEGKVHVGLSSDELEFLAWSKTTLKVSRRDLPYVISKVETFMVNIYIIQRDLQYEYEWYMHHWISRDYPEELPSQVQWSQLTKQEFLFLWLEVLVEYTEKEKIVSHIINDLFTIDYKSEV